MKIGSGWTKETEDKKIYISVSLNEIFGEWFPFLKKCFITIWHIPEEERKNENSPNWTISLNIKKEKQDDYTPDYL